MHDLGADAQRQQQLEHGDVERQRGDRQPAGRRAPMPGLALHARQEVHHRAVRHAHALGLAGRAGGVDHVGRRRRSSVARRERAARVGTPAGVGVERRAAPAASLRPVRRRAASAVCVSSSARLRVLGHEGEALARERRVERHVGGARLAARRAAPTSMSVPRSRHRPTQLAAARRRGSRSMRGNRLARASSSRVAPARRRRSAARCAPACVRPGAKTSAAMRRSCGEAASAPAAARAARPPRPATAAAARPSGLRRIAATAAQQRLVRVQPAARSSPSSNRSVLYWHSSRRPPSTWHRVDEQLEVLEAARHCRRTRRRGRRRPSARASQSPVEVEQHADQRQAARVARRAAACCSSVPKVQRLVLEGVEQQSPRLRPSTSANGASASTRARSGSRLTQWPTSAGMAARRLAGGRNADHQVVLAGQAVQQRGEAAEQRREQARAALRAGACAARRPARHRAAWSTRCEAKVRTARARPVERQFEHRQRPPAKRASQYASSARCIVGLPRVAVSRERVVGERAGAAPASARRRRAPRRTARPSSSRDHAPRPAVADDVVRRRAAARARRRRGAAARRGTADPASRSKGVSTTRRSVGRELGRARCRRQRGAGRAARAAARRCARDAQLRAVGAEGRAQGLVALDQRLQRRRKRVRVERAAQAQRRRFVVGQRGLAAPAGRQPDLALRLGAWERRARSGRAANGSKSTSVAVGSSMAAWSFMLAIFTVLALGASGSGTNQAGWPSRRGPGARRAPAAARRRSVAAVGGAARQEFGFLQLGDRFLERRLDGRDVLLRVRRGQEAGEVVEDVDAAAAHHREQQVLQRMVFAAS